MSKTNQNALTRYYSGKFGQDFVFRNYNGMSTMAKLPRRSHRRRSARELETVARFRLASHWARRCLVDPELRAFYQSKPEKGVSVYRLALKDYLRSPVVERICAEEYVGKPGDRITVIAKDDFAVAKVHLRIARADGTLVEEGPCGPGGINSVWEYVATVEIAAHAGVNITATAWDTPGNAGKLAVTL
jgi:hypothetical protein